MNTVSWGGYPFEVCHHNANWNEVAGVYIFTGLNRQGQWVALYIGQTDNFRNRIPPHEQWNQAVRLGATHVHAMVVPQQAKRDEIEQSLIQRFRPPLNVQLKHLV